MAIAQSRLLAQAAFAGAGRDLARERVLDFIGAPGAQIQTAARLWGHCAICGRGLTDPLSLERGVGPECIERVTDAIRFLAREGSSRENISLITGMLMDFIEEVLKEAQRNRKASGDLFDAGPAS